MRSRQTHQIPSLILRQAHRIRYRPSTIADRKGLEVWLPGGGDALLAGCLTMAISVRAELFRCAGRRLLAGNAVSQSGG